MDLGGYLAQIRQARGYSLRELADRCGVSASELSRVESGSRKKVSPSVLRAVADALVVSYPYLMQLAGYIDDPDAGQPEPEEVLRDGRTGSLVDLSSGMKEMYRTDAAWASVAFRVSRELGEKDRQMLTRLALQYLKDQEEES